MRRHYFSSTTNGRSVLGDTQYRDPWWGMTAKETASHVSSWCPMVSLFQNSWGNLESGISFHQTTSDLSHLGCALSGRPGAHQTVFLNQCLIFHSNSSNSQSEASKLHCGQSEASITEHLNQVWDSETAKKCLLVFPCLQRGPGQVVSVQISILIWAERALGRHREDININ